MHWDKWTNVERESILPPPATQILAKDSIIDIYHVTPPVQLGVLNTEIVNT